MNQVHYAVNYHPDSGYILHLYCTYVSYYTLAKRGDHRTVCGPTRYTMLLLSELLLYLLGMRTDTPRCPYQSYSYILLA